MHKPIQNKTEEQAFWDKVANERIYAAFDNDEYIELFDKSMGQELSGKIAVDIGCASGVSAGLLAARGAKVLGIDISPELIDQATKLWPEYSETINFSVGDAENLDIKDNSVDYCFFGGVLHHFPVRHNVYREVLRILKPGGKFIAIEPNKLDFFEQVEWKVAGWRGKLSPNEFPIDPVNMKNEMTKCGYKSILFWTTRQDIPVLAQFPILKNFFNRNKGFWLKGKILKIVNCFRSSESCGNFFVIEATKE